MSRMALNIAHFKQGAIGSLGGHNWYKRGEHDEHSNQDIDPQRSKDNIALVLPKEGTFYRDVKATVEQSTGRVTSASVWVSEWVLYPPEELQDPRTADRDKLQQFYGDALDWMQEQGYLVKLAVVHLDETTVHAHIDTVPLTQDGRLSRKDVYTRAALNEIHTALSDHLAAKGWDIQRGESTKGKQVRAKTLPEYKKQAEAEKLQLIQQVNGLEKTVGELQRQLTVTEQRAFAAESELAELQERVMLNHQLVVQQDAVISQQQQQMEAAEEWLNQISDWPAYEKMAMDAWHALDNFRKLLQDTFNSGWIFRNKRAEQGILEAVSGLRDFVMSAISALRGFEVRERVPEPQQRSQVLSRGLDDLIRNAEERTGPQKQITDKIKNRDAER